MRFVLDAGAWSAQTDVGYARIGVWSKFDVRSVLRLKRVLVQCYQLGFLVIDIHLTALHYVGSSLQHHTSYPFHRFMPFFTTFGPIWLL